MSTSQPGVLFPFFLFYLLILPLAAGIETPSFSCSYLASSLILSFLPGDFFSVSPPPTQPFQLLIEFCSTSRRHKSNLAPSSPCIALSTLSSVCAPSTPYDSLLHFSSHCLEPVLFLTCPHAQEQTHPLSFADPFVLP